MRRVRSLAPLLVLTLGLAAPAAADEVAVQGVDYEFLPRIVKVAPGDTVTWSFAGVSEHTSTSVRRQAERWSSGLRSAGDSYSHTFTKPGRYQYICLPHRFTMRGTVQVGDDAVKRSFGRVSTTVRGRRARSRLRLREPARIRAVVRGPKRLRVEIPAAEPGRVVVRWGRRLEPGRYRGTVAAVDDFDVKTVRRVRFRIAAG